MKGIPARYINDTTTSRAIYPSSKQTWYISLLICCKALLCVGIFVAYDLLNVANIVPLVCLLKFIAGGILMYIQKPFSVGHTVSQAQWFRVLQFSVLRTVQSILWFYGLSLCGPFRTILITQHYDFAVVAGIGTLFSGLGSPAVYRGTMLFLCAVVSLLFIDHDEGQQHPGDSHLFSSISSWLGFADHKVKGTMSFPSMIFHFLIVATLIFVINYYVDVVCIQRLDVPRVARIGSISLFIWALIAAMLWQSLSFQRNDIDEDLFSTPIEEHTMSGGSIFACGLFILASLGLTSTTKGGARGSFIGYSATGLPLYNFTNSALHQTSRSVLMVASSFLKQILMDHNSRRIFYFLCLNLSFTAIEFLYGIWTNSLGLISDGFHMLFDCSALIMGLLASVMARWKPSKTFSYGYGRVEDLSGFVNGLFLMVISLFVFSEAVSRLLDPPHISTQRLLVVSVGGLCVNLVGILAFRHSHSHGHNHSHEHGPSYGHSHSVGAHGHSHNANMEGVFLHVMADTLGSVGVIVSSILIEQFGWYIADPLCSMFIAILIFMSVLPLLKNSALVLLLRTPLRVQDRLPAALSKVSALEGVIGIRQPHFWQHSSDMIIGSIHVQALPEASEQKIIQEVTAIFKEIGFYQFNVQVEKEQYFTHMTGLSSQLKADFGFSVEGRNSLIMVKAI
ncbi:proton-coupled zinc antiporter SLC30A5-like isoform X2 [Periplaneta americana]|uniref:proton-coupled zinc antiporter SLC30A5-like isoform X2 n=1 Tax=Periplaneta americana TaxID=6978 RepID=UPI0037E9843B